MKRTAPYWESPLDLFKLLMTALAAALLLGMLRGCVPGGAAVDTPEVDVDLPGTELGITAPSFDLPSISDVDLPALSAGGYEIGGVALPGSEVELFDGDLSLGKVLAGPDGKWAFALPALAAGAHALRAVAPDRDGNPFDMTLPAFELPDVDLPSAEMPDLALGGLDLSLPDLDFGGVDLPSLGDLKGFELSGLALPGSEVEVFDGELSLGTVTADADGKWRFALPALAAGAHSITFQGLDLDGAPLDLPGWDFDLPGQSLPSLNLGDLGSRFAAADLPELSGTAPAGSTVRIYDGDALLGEAEADAEGRWTFALPELLGSGDHVLRAAILGPDAMELESEAWRFNIEAPAEDVMDAAGDAAPAASDDEAAEEGDSSLPSGLPKTGRAPLTP